MQIALDIVGRRVFAHKAVKGENFYCPLCGRGLNVCQGSIKTAYFAHKANDLCEDSWKYDMSEWHRSMQSRFPEEQREVVVRHHGKKHRADVLYGNQIIEFQHSPISMEEILERNHFYNSAGYNVAWVFDLQDQYESERINQWDCDWGIGFQWSYPKSSLKCFPRPNKNGNGLVIYFYWIDSAGEENFNRVIWSSHDNGTPNFKKFVISEDVLETDGVDSLLEINDFFATRMKMSDNGVKNKSPLQRCISTLGAGYKIKRSGAKGYPRNDYVCPRYDVFGIKRYTEKGCSYCKYCAAIYKMPNGFQSYCFFPRQVRDEDGVHPGYECASVIEF